MGNGFREDRQVSDFEPRYNTTVQGIVNTIEWLLIAVVLAFVFRAFVVEAFRIPTGSMAETLRGDHYHLRCPRCAFEYDLGKDEGGELPRSRCPSCSYWTSVEQMPPVAPGDRIFVFKSIYQFVEPKRWDVVVFKFPVRPEENYIKRAIAFPGEKLELMDGDVYIDGLIERKPPKVQDELWVPLYVNDYHPSGRAARQFEAPPAEGQIRNLYANEEWVQPFTNKEASRWNTSAGGHVVFSLVSPGDEVNTLYFEDHTGHTFEANYAYNSNPHAIKPEVSDLRLEFNVAPGSESGVIGAGLRKNEIWYRGLVDFGGSMVIERMAEEGSVELAKVNIEDARNWSGEQFSFQVVDHLLVLRIGDYELKYDAGREPGVMGNYRRDHKPGVEIYGAGAVDISHIALYRDIYYDTNVLRPRAGESFTLGTDEYFMIGDNTPISQDSRMWRDPGRGNNGETFRAGTVPRKYLVGKAFFLYWGDAYKPFDGSLPIVPNLSTMKPIYGGVAEGDK